MPEQRTLTRAPEIRKALRENEQGQGGQIHCAYPGEENARITKAKIDHGTLKVYVLNTGKWVIPTQVWVCARHQPAYRSQQAIILHIDETDEEFA